MSIHSLPQELIDCIIDFLYDDTPTLLNSALVCRKWLPASRLHLFSKIRLDVPRSLPHPLFTEDGTRITHPPCHRLYTLLASNPDIIHYIQELKICSGFPSLPILAEDLAASFSQLAHPWIFMELSLPFLLHSLTDLRRFEFCSDPPMSWEVLPLELLEALEHVMTLPSLNYVRLQCWEFPDVSRFERLLSGCIGLKGLALWSIKLGEDDAEGSQDGDGAFSFGVVGQHGQSAYSLDGSALDSGSEDEDEGRIEGGGIIDKEIGHNAEITEDADTGSDSDSASDSDLASVFTSSSNSESEVDADTDAGTCSPPTSPPLVPDASVSSLPAEVDLPSSTPVPVPTSSIPHIECLIMEYVDCTHLVSWLLSPTPPVDFSSLREVRIAHCTSESSFSLSVSTSSSSEGESDHATLGHLYDPNSQFIQHLLEVVGPSLERFHFKPGTGTGFGPPATMSTAGTAATAGPPIHPLSLSANPSLQVVHLTLEESPSTLTWASNLLATLPCTVPVPSAATDKTNAERSCLTPQPTPTPTPQATTATTGILAAVTPTRSSSTNSDSGYSSYSENSALCLAAEPVSSYAHSSPSLSPSLPVEVELPLSPLKQLTLDLYIPPSMLLSSPSTSSTSSQEPQTSYFSSLNKVLSRPEFRGLEEVGIGLFAKPNSTEFTRVKDELAGLCGRVTEPEQEDVVEIEDAEDQDEGTRQVKQAIRRKDVVNMYQLGTKRQRLSSMSQMG